MIAAMLYTAAVGTVLVAAAAAAERAALRAGRPLRGVWAAALCAACLVPAATLVGPAPGGAAATVMLDATAAARTSSGDGAPAWRTMLAWAAGVLTDAARWRGGDGPIVGTWLALSLSLAVRRLAAARRLRAAATAWPARVVGGERVRLSPDAGPALFGVWRPAVVLPAWALGDARLGLMLRHEREHRRARDPLLLAAADLLALAVPWNLPLWWARARLRAAVEIDCDARVLAGGAADARGYGHLLLDVAGRAPGARFPSLGLAERPTVLRRRIRMLATPRPSRSALPAAPAAAAALVIAVGALALPRPPVAWARAAATAPQDSAKRRMPGDSVREGRSDRPERMRRLEGADRPPLYVVDGKVLAPPRGRTDPDVPPEGLPSPDRIASVNVLKGDAARRAYGDRGRDGVVEITTKPAP